MPLIDDYRIERDRLASAITDDNLEAVQDIDARISKTFSAIMKMEPETQEERQRLIAFLLDFCCSSCNGPSISVQVRQRLLDLTRFK